VWLQNQNYIANGGIKQMKWELPRENYFVKKPEYPVFSMLLIILLVFCGSAILELMGWPEGKKFNNEF
jgi:hypothetical protein